MFEAFKVTVGEEGLNETWQAKFPKTVECKCGGEARHGFTAKEEFSGTPGEGHVCDLHDNNGEGAYWLHDCCAVAVYFCKDCLETTSKYNQA